MKKSLVFLEVIVFLAACSGLEQLDSKVAYDDALVSKVIFEVLPIRDGDSMDTKASAVPNGSTVNFVWEASDTVGIYPDKGSQVYFNIEDGVGTSSVSFDGGGWALKQNSSYVSYYPFVGDIYLKRDKIPVSFIGQKQTGMVSPFNGARYYLATEASTSTNGVLTFTYNTLNTIINVNATLSAGTYTKMSLNLSEPLFVEEGTYSLDDRKIVGTKFTNTLEIELEDFTLAEQGTVPVYIMSAPVDLRGKEVVVRFTKSDGAKYKCTKSVSREYLANTRYGLTCNQMQKEAEIINFVDPEVKRLCVENWDTDGDGDFSYEEAAAVTDLNQCFKNNTIITSFDELQYFTGLTYIGKKETYSNGYSILSSDFWGCTNLSSVVLPETVKEIGSGAFSGCKSLSSIEIPASVSSIYGNAFGGTGLTSITFPEGSSINFHEGAFAQCMSLSTVRFEGAISSYGVEAGIFEDCPITNLYFGKDFNYLGVTESNYLGYLDNMFFQLFKYYRDDDLLNICTIEVSDQNSKYDSRGNCNALIETVTNTLILGCNNTSIPESVTCIASGSFSDIDALTSFVVPATVTSIGSAFDLRLESIIVNSTTPPTLIDNGLFGFNWDNDDTPTIIYVPTESLNAYKTADGWSRYADRIYSVEGGDVPPSGDGGDD